MSGEQTGAWLGKTLSLARQVGVSPAASGTWAGRWRGGGLRGSWALSGEMAGKHHGARGSCARRCVLSRPGRGQLSAVAAWLEERSCGRSTGWSTRYEMRLLLEFPTSALLSSSQLTRRLMAACLSEEDWRFVTLQPRAILGGPQQAGFRCGPPWRRRLCPAERRARRHWAPSGSESRGWGTAGCRCADVALHGGRGEVAASGSVGEVLAIGFFPSDI